MPSWGGNIDFPIAPNLLNLDALQSAYEKSSESVNTSIKKVEVFKEEVSKDLNELCTRAN